MEKTRDQVIDDLCQRGFLNCLFDDKKESLKVTQGPETPSTISIWY